MSVHLQIEHGVADFDSWKAAFDADPVGRASGGVRRYEVQRPIGEAGSVVIDLEFDDRATAEAFGQALQRLWQGAGARSVMAGPARVRLLETVDGGAY